MSFTSSSTLFTSTSDSISMILMATSLPDDRKTALNTSPNPLQGGAAYVSPVRRRDRLCEPQNSTHPFPILLVSSKTESGSSLAAKTGFGLAMPRPGGPT